MQRTCAAGRRKAGQKIEDILTKAGAGLAALVEKELKEMRSASKAESDSQTAEAILEEKPYFEEGEFSEGEPGIANITPEIHVDLDAEYFKWKEGQQGPAEEKKERHFLFGRKS